MGVTYANVADLESRWRPLSAAEREVAMTLLADASVEMRSACPGLDDRIATGETEAGAAIIVACRMVKRSMQSSGAASEVGEGVKTLQDTWGQFSLSRTFDNPSGSVYVTKADKKLLGYGRQVAFTIPMTAEPGSVT